MNHLARLLAVAGLALAVMLFAHEGVGGIIVLVGSAGLGLVLAALVHVLPMVANAVAWRRLIDRRKRPDLRVLVLATWIRESVNGLLPVARIGGEIAAYRILRRRLTDGGEAAASLVADMSLSVLSQALFALLGLALLFARGGASTLMVQFLWGVGVAIPLGAGFVIAQRAGALGTLMRAIDRLAAGRLRLASGSLQFDAALRTIYRTTGDVAACFAWQIAGWVLGAGEIWLALYFLGSPCTVLDAIMIEALIQAVSSAAFLVPAALGVQEGAFLLIGAAIGMDATTALALATSRRLRDLIIFFPGLLVWQWTERHVRAAGPAGEQRLS